MYEIIEISLCCCHQVHPTPVILQRGQDSYVVKSPLSRDYALVQYEFVTLPFRSIKKPVIKLKVSTQKCGAYEVIEMSIMLQSSRSSDIRNRSTGTSLPFHAGHVRCLIKDWCTLHKQRCSQNDLGDITTYGNLFQ